jgi:glyoxylase-like metal-dependent hydrolase (beta-lactamase superfamily II)
MRTLGRDRAPLRTRRRLRLRLLPLPLALVIATPGHTSGVTAFLWDTGRHRLRFTGDTIFVKGGQWVAAVLDSSARDPYVESLELIRELDNDVLVPWIGTAGDPDCVVTSRANARRRTRAILERVRRGEDDR